MTHCSDTMPHIRGYIGHDSDDNLDGTCYLGLGLRNLNFGFRFRSRLSWFKYLICLDAEGRIFSGSLLSLVNFTPHNVSNIFVSELG